LVTVYKLSVPVIPIVWTWESPAFY